MRHSESPRDRCPTTAVCCDSLLVMRGDDSLPDDVAILKRLLAGRNAELARARAEVSSAEALIAHLRLTIEKMRRELYGSRSERKARLLDQMELELEELEAAAAEDELAAERAAAPPEETTAVRGFSRKNFCAGFGGQLRASRQIPAGVHEAGNQTGVQRINSVRVHDDRGRN